MSARASEDCEVCGMSYEDADHTSCEEQDDFTVAMKTNSQILRTIEQGLPGVILQSNVWPEVGIYVKKGMDKAALRKKIAALFKDKPPQVAIEDWEPSQSAYQ